MCILFYHTPTRRSEVYKKANRRRLEVDNIGQELLARRAYANNQQEMHTILVRQLGQILRGWSLRILKGFVKTSIEETVWDQINDCVEPICHFISFYFRIEPGLPVFP